MALDDLLQTARQRLPLLQETTPLSTFTTPPQAPVSPAPPSPPRSPAAPLVAPVPSPQVEDPLQGLRDQNQGAMASLAFSPATQTLIEKAIGPILNHGIGGTGSPQGDIDAAINTIADGLRGSSYSGPTSFKPLASGKFPVVDKTPASVPSPSEVSPEIQRTASEAWARWPGLTNLGTHVVRNIAGTNTPSQHSYGNAIDFGGSPKQLSQLATWAADNARKLNISQVIYRDSIWTSSGGWHPYTSGGHETHVHITGPMRYSSTAPNFPTVTRTSGSRRTPTPVRARRSQQR